MTFRPFRSLAFAACTLAGFSSSPGEVTLPAIFSDHMILQKLAKVPIWGKASPGEHVIVKIDQTQGETEAGPDGKWRVILDLHAEPEGPFTFTIQGKNLLTITDVLIGEVWLCGGQSNMELPMDRTLGARETVAASANSRIRLFRVKNRFALKPLDECEGKWYVAGPETVGNFTAVGYYFARKVQTTLKVPVGLIHANYGGSTIEAWLGDEAIRQDPDLKAKANSLLDAAVNYAPRFTDFQTRYAAWEKQNQRADQPRGEVSAFAGPGVVTSDWKTFRTPGKFADQGLPDAGAIWLRQTVEVPVSATSSYLTLHLGNIRDFDQVYWNGVEIGSTSAMKTTSYNDGTGGSLNRRYDIPQSAVKAGESVLAIRVFSPGGGGGIEGNSNAGSGINLTHDWQAKAEFALPPLSPQAMADYPQRPLVPAAERSTATELYNGMIHPIIPYGLRGFLWYQGESNVGRAVFYQTELALLIKEWRDEWDEGNIPFYYCQLANFMAKKSAPGESEWAEMREATTSTLSVPGTGQAVAIDLGEAEDIHYRNKKDAGERLALVALAQTYGEKIPSSGPVYVSSAVEGNQIRVTFDHTEGGLVARALPASYQPKSLLPGTVPLVRNSPESEVEGFAICGVDRKWVWANTKIEGDSVIVSSLQVPSPVAVRYAWADNPTCNLYNGAGLPAGPFRTDSFPLTTEKRKY